MPTVFAFDGVYFGWSGSDVDKVSNAQGRYLWSPGLPSKAQKGTGRVLDKQSATLAFSPLTDDLLPLTGRLGLYVGSTSQLTLLSDDNPELFDRLDDGAVVVTLDDSRLALLSVGRHPVELWDEDEDMPVSQGTLTKVASVRQE